jgi:hypothetical protein
METISLDELLMLFKSPVHAQLKAALERDDVRGLAVYEAGDGTRSARPFTGRDLPKSSALSVVRAVYLKPEAVLSGSRTMEALKWMENNPGKSAYTAAAKFGITAGAVYAAKKRRRNKPICPCCGQVIKGE